MIVVCVGVDHQTAPLAMRERLAYSMSQAETLYLDFAAGRFIDALPIEELALLSTCNRVELYGAVPNERAASATTDAMWRFLWRGRDDAPGAIAPQGYAFTGSHAERHLCRVAAGLESMLLGEAEVLGQIADAFALAQRARAIGSTLEALFNAALRAGRRARTETSIGRNPASVSSVAVDLAAALAPQLRGRKVLILGAGKMARIAAELLVARGEWTISIASRTLEHARLLAERVHGYPIALEALPNALADVDQVIACSASPTPILGEALVRAAMRERADRPLTIIDIAVPRDVDPAAGSLDQVFLYNIDDLQSIVKENLARRSSEVQRAELIVREEVDRFRAWMQSREVVPTVIALRQRFEAIRLAELERLEPKLASLPPEARARVDEVTHLLIEKLLLTPTERLKGADDEAQAVAYADALNRLFSLTPARRDPPE